MVPILCAEQAAVGGHLVTVYGIVRTTEVFETSACLLSEPLLLNPVNPARATQRSHLNPLTVR
jgi:hypothetical protein